MTWRHKEPGNQLPCHWFSSPRRFWFQLMMTSSNGSIFRATGHLCGEFTGHQLNINGSNLKIFAIDFSPCSSIHSTLHESQSIYRNELLSSLEIEHIYMKTGVALKFIINLWMFSLIILGLISFDIPLIHLWEIHYFSPPLWRPPVIAYNFVSKSVL